MRLEWKLTCVIICQWWGIIMSMFFYRKFEGNNWHAATTMQRKQIFPQAGNKSERLLNLSLKCMQRHTNKLSVTFLINNSTSCCWEKRGGGGWKKHNPPQGPVWLTLGYGFSYARLTRIPTLPVNSKSLLKTHSPSRIPALIIKLS